MVLTFPVAACAVVQQGVGLQDSTRDIKPKKKKLNKSSKSTPNGLQTNKLEQQFKYGTMYSG